MKAKILPLADRVVIEPEEPRDKVKGGIIIPDTAKEKPQRGKVVAVGAGRRSDEGKKIPPVLKKGDQVLFAKYAGTELEVEGRKFLIMKEDDVLATL